MHERATDKARADAQEARATPAKAELASESPEQYFSIARREGAWRDALLRRMLAVADVLAGLAASATLAVSGSGSFGAALWSALLAPVWVVTSKLIGLYDRDQRSLRHLTVDELPRLFTWSLTSTATIALLLAFTPAESLGSSDLLRMGVASVGVGAVLRVLARNAWRRITPPERAVIVGDSPMATAVRRKLDL